MSAAHYIMIGGFLGAGKTTSINRLAAQLTAQGRTVGLITNDQGVGLTDTAIARSGQFPVEEITGGCFCCRFDSLVEAARQLRSRARPDCFIAEPVGSCTDLAATVGLPLQHLYGDQFSVAPLSVVLDPLRALTALGLDDRRRFSSNVVYIFRKQIEEAEVIAINKCDLMAPDRLGVLQAALRAEFPSARQFLVSARTGEGLDAWFSHIMNERMDVRRTMDVDYAVYGDGEARLGWLNATIALHGDSEWDGNRLIGALALAIREYARREDVEIAHLKMTLGPPGDPLTLAAINLVSTARDADFSHRLDEPLDDGVLLLNLRAEADPGALDAALRTAVENVCRRDFGLDASIEASNHFRPGQPNPTHRLTRTA